MSVSTSQSPLQLVALVARREFDVTVHRRSFWISNVIVLAIIIGGIVVAGLAADSGDRTSYRVGVVGDGFPTQSLTDTGDSAGIDVRLKRLTNWDEAGAAVRDGSVDVALVPASPQPFLLAPEDPSPTLVAVIDSTLREKAVEALLVNAGVDSSAMQSAIERAGPVTTVLDPSDPDKEQRQSISFVVVLVLYMQIIGFGAAVSMGVIEEKSSRVVELLLSTLRPLQLLWGKVIGIGAVGLMQLVIYGVAALTTAELTGSVTITGAAVSAFASAVGWFILGYAFFSVGYAAAGSLVSRAEDAGSVQMPMMFLVIGTAIVAFSTVGQPDSTLAVTLSWIPPFSALLMPMRIAAGSASVVQVFGSIALMLLATAALSVLAAKIYQRSILRLGARISWREAIFAGSRG